MTETVEQQVSTWNKLPGKARLARLCACGRPRRKNGRYCLACHARATREYSHKRTKRSDRLKAELAEAKDWRREAEHELFERGRQISTLCQDVDALRREKAALQAVIAEQRMTIQGVTARVDVLLGVVRETNAEFSHARKFDSRLPELDEWKRIKARAGAAGTV